MLNFVSSLSERRYLRTVFLDRPVRRDISRIEKWSRKCQRRMTLNNSMSITPSPPAKPRGKVRTWVSSRWKNPCCPGQLSVEINNLDRFTPPEGLAHHRCRESFFVTP